MNKKDKVVRGMMVTVLLLFSLMAGIFVINRRLTLQNRAAENDVLIHPILTSAPQNAQSSIQRSVDCRWNGTAQDGYSFSMRALNNQTGVEVTIPQNELEIDVTDNGDDTMVSFNAPQDDTTYTCEVFLNGEKCGQADLDFQQAITIDDGGQTVPVVPIDTDVPAIPADPKTPGVDVTLTQPSPTVSIPTIPLATTTPLNSPIPTSATGVTVSPTVKLTLTVAPTTKPTTTVLTNTPAPTIKPTSLPTSTTKTIATSTPKPKSTTSTSTTSTSTSSPSTTTSTSSGSSQSFTGDNAIVTVTPASGSAQSNTGSTIEPSKSSISVSSSPISTKTPTPPISGIATTSIAILALGMLVIVIGFAL